MRMRMRWLALCLSLPGFAACGPEGAGALAPSVATAGGASAVSELTSSALEQQIGSPLVSYIDPEYSRDAQRVTFQDGNNVVWLGGINQALGKMTPADGRGTKLGTTLSLQQTYNGPEFGYSRLGEAVVWTGVDPSNGRRHCMLARNGVTTQLTSGDWDFSINLPSKRSASAAQLVLGQRTERPGRDFIWFSEANPSVLHPFPVASIGSSGPRWYLDEEVIITNLVDAQGATQLALYDTATAALAQITFDSGDKADGFAFLAPEFGDTPIIVSTIDSHVLAFYQPQGAVFGPWARVQTITSVDPIRSAEPVVFANKSRVSYVQNLGGSQTKTAIVVADFDGTLTPASLTADLNRTDPESFVIGNTLYVTYYAPGRLSHLNLYLSALAP